MKRAITHTTAYHYESPVFYALQKVRLRPQPGPMQQVLGWDVVVDGGKIETSYNDHYGNRVDLISADVGTQSFTITARGEVEVNDTGGVLGMVYGRAPLWHFQQHTALTATSDRIGAMAKLIHAQGNILNGLHAMSAAILEQVSYETGNTHTQTTAAQAVDLGKGVCQDHSHIFIAAARSVGIPARYVSGYLYMPDREEQEATHAWAEAHVPDLGWVGFDVSNGVSPDVNYIRIAIGRDANDATPVTGMRMGSGDASLIVSLQVQQ